MSEPTCTKCGCPARSYGKAKRAACAAIGNRLCDCECVFPEPVPQKGVPFTCAHCGEAAFSELPGAALCPRCFIAGHRGFVCSEYCVVTPDGEELAAQYGKDYAANPSLSPHGLTEPAVDVGPCEICKYHWNLIVMPGDEHSIHCPDHPKNLKLREPVRPPTDEVSATTERCPVLECQHPAHVGQCQVGYGSYFCPCTGQTKDVSTNEVLAALAELRGMLGVAVDISVHDQGGKPKWFVSRYGSTDTLATGATLAEAMQKVREWKEGM